MSFKEEWERQRKAKPVTAFRQRVYNDQARLANMRVVQEKKESLTEWLARKRKEAWEERNSKS